MKRILVDGSFEPTWRKNARRDADTFQTELLRATPSRRAFLAGGGAALLLEYVAQRRAVAFPFPHGAVSSSGVTGITNARTGTQYQYLPQALNAMQGGDTILLPAGLTYQYLGTTYYYADWNNTWVGAGTPYSQNAMYLGATSPPYGGITGTADYGTIQGSGSANNGRALISPPYGILAADFGPTDTVMVFDPSSPIANFRDTSIVSSLMVNGSYNFGEYYNYYFTFTGRDTGANSLIGVASNFVRTTTIPMGTIITSTVGSGNKGIFVAAGQNPGWTFNNLELAYTHATGSDPVCSIRQETSFPGYPEVGSIAMSNCYVHECKQGIGIGYTGLKPTTFAHLFDTEIYKGGSFNSAGQMHNIYVGAIGELVMDNCYSHFTTGAWLLKSRAALNLVTYCQIRGERTDPNTSVAEGSGCDFSDGGLTYLIGNIHQQSLHGSNTMVNYNAEAAHLGSATGGANNPIQELYVVNGTFAGATAGTSWAPVCLQHLGVGQPPISKMGQTGGGSLAARRYWAVFNNTGAMGGVTWSGPPAAPIGGVIVYETLPVSANNVLTLESPATMTGASGWNCWANYADPNFFNNAGTYHWDAGFTQPIFALVGGGSTISVTGTLTNGSNTITGVSGLVGLASIWQLSGMVVYVGGVSADVSVWFADPSTNSLVMTGAYGGSTATVTITFGHILYFGFTYQTALGDSINMALTVGDTSYSLPESTGPAWTNGSYTNEFTQLSFCGRVQVPPGDKLTVNAPPSGPAWASGVNFWATSIVYFFADGTSSFTDISDNVTKQNASPIAFGGSFTSAASVVVPAAQILRPNVLLQNAAPIAFGTGFTEPNTGLVNNLNPTTSKLQWYRRASISPFGKPISCWYAVVPFGGLSGYSDTFWMGFPWSTAANVAGSVSVWRGCAANIFDDNFQAPAKALSSGSTSVDTAAGKVTVISAFATSSGTAGAGFTQVSAQFLLNVSYASFVGVQTGLAIAQTGGSTDDPIVVDALTGSAAAPTLVSNVTITAVGNAFNFTIASANEGDVLYLVVSDDSGEAVAGVGRIGTPLITTATAGSPVVLIQNSILANFNPSRTGGVVSEGDSQVTVPGGYVTETTNLPANSYNGSIFTAPLWATVFADSVQADYDYRLAVSSPALNSASNPGSSPEGQSLIPVSQSAWHGSPTPGTPIPAKVARTDIGPALTGSIGALT